jgi:hypothetical protein
VSTPPAPPAPAKEPAKVEIKTSTKVTKASFVIYVNVGEGIEVEPTQELVNELLAAGAFRWVGDRLVANLTYVER